MTRKIEMKLDSMLPQDAYAHIPGLADLVKAHLPQQPEQISVYSDVPTLNAALAVMEQIQGASPPFPELFCVCLTQTGVAVQLPEADFLLSNLDDTTLSAVDWMVAVQPETLDVAAFTVNEAMRQRASEGRWVESLLYDYAARQKAKQHEG